MTTADAEGFEPGDRAIIKDTPAAGEVASAIRARGAEVLVAKHWLEAEHVLTVGTRTCVRPESVLPVEQRGARALSDLYDPQTVAGSEASFDAAWDNLSSPPDTNPIYTPTADLVPADWVPLLPYPTFNPAQVQALPAVRGARSTMVVAPTGAGKTVVGMLGALNEIKARGGAAAWLVPQRTLTAELDGDLGLWRDQGMKIARLSGDVSTDMAAVAEADLIVATTEKFESLCRNTKLADVVARIGTVIVDEIHLLGEEGRGATLEALLARLRQNTDVKIIGLSATVANADQVAEWLRADLVRIAWRPTRLNQQVLTVPTAEREALQEYRSAAAVYVVDEISRDQGSTIVFCGSKFSVRSTALDIARSRGQDITGIDPGDIEEVARVAHAAKIGMHYSDWPHRDRALRAFADREFDVLVATSTVAAGVNTPARAVVIRDTSIGPTPMPVSMIQQMQGRAGRAGKESEGWAFIITQSDETALWRKLLADGYTVLSRLADTLKDHLLGEIAQGRIASEDEARDWWRQTFAYHQGTHSDGPVNEALESLTKNGFAKIEDDEALVRPKLSATPMGKVTARMMINVNAAIDLRHALRAVRILPTKAVEAERHVIDAIANLYAYRNVSAPTTNEARAAVMNAIPTLSGEQRRVSFNRNGLVDCSGNDVVRAALWLAAIHSDAFHGKPTQVRGVPMGTLHHPLDTAPRYLAWIAANGSLGTVPPWSAVVASDLGPRARWHTLSPDRGDGRALRLSEKSVGGQLPVGRMREAFDRFRGEPGPALKVEHKARGRDLAVRINAPERSSVFVLNQPARKDPDWQRSSAGRTLNVQGIGEPVAAAFMASGDCVATGWLAAFTR